MQQRASTDQAMQSRGGAAGGNDCSKRDVQRLEARDVGRDALPASIAQPPIVGVAAGPLRAIRFLITGARMEDGEVAKNTNDHIMLADVLDRGASTDLRKKGLAVDEGTVGVGVEKTAARLASNQATSASSTERM